MDETRIINQGDLFWLKPDDADPRIPHPHVVIQISEPNSQTVVVCALTSNIGRVSLPGNVLLEAGEANLPRQSVVEVSKTVTIPETRLREYIGTLDERRIRQILAGIAFLQKSFFNR